ncbi:hypothetical protein EJ06DRAFT_475314 [Trichodelitschia bisporula]|uniref:Trafficking protein particle complex subunit 11 domain-containing protein n=1 Tax=Trichodelitschia bisporula TaxID=703511 RepID=A0A6G1HYQ0_9PEZI|nr:hypothetical protein EJ06DRAFT_475314 [Trichodelitschia bisporula]
MDAYPLDYVSHNLPLVVLSGLRPTPDTETPAGHGTTINSELPLVEGERAEQLLSEFSRAEGTDRPRAGASKLMGFKFKVVGRQYSLPPRKAQPPQDSPSLRPLDEPRSPVWALHSPISPLSPGSPIYPDGVMLPVWVAKHQHQVPATFVAFFDFASDTARNSLHDNQLKTDINAIKAALYRSGYKSRLVVVLLSDTTILSAPDIEDRLATIRRATGLDSKTGLFFLPPNISRVEVASFVDSLLLALQPGCVEYYRDLTKHARRKKNRGSIPPPTAPPTRGTSQTLAALGWGVRYDFKLGVFAEFRQEMEAACRHYTLALELLLGPDGIFETTASWSPRWDEARLLADAVAIRIIRCLLWSQLTSSAAQSWLNYRDRLRELVDRRGKGSSNYGWEAWESRWAKIMAQLIQRANMATLSDSDAVFAPAEKGLPIGERLTPWYLLHHAGYWQRMAAKHAMARRSQALSLAEEDRTPPGKSPASAVARRYGTDTFLCPEPHAEYPLSGPGFNHSLDILEKLSDALTTFKEKRQNRMADFVRLDVCREHFRANQPDLALAELKKLWREMAWRKERWWRLVFEVCRALHECARLTGDVEGLVVSQYELLALPFATNHAIDLMAAGAGGEGSGEAVEIDLSSENVASFLSGTFVFSQAEANVGEPLRAQLTLRSNAQSPHKPVILSSVAVQFAGSITDVKILHQAASEATEAKPIRQLTLREEDRSTLVGETDLQLSPGGCIVIEFPLTLREAGNVLTESIHLNIETEAFASRYSASLDAPALWWMAGPNRLVSRRIHRDEPAAVKVLPRPPKMNVATPDASQNYYTDELISLDILVTNSEDEETEGTLEVRILSREATAPAFVWVDADASDDVEPDAHGDNSDSDSDDTADLPGHPIGRLAPGTQKTKTIRFSAPPDPTDLVLEVKVLYHLLSDRQTPVSKTHAADINIVRAFEANYEFKPLFHPEAWPSFFTPPASDSKPAGISHRWRLISRLTSFAEQALTVDDVDLVLQTASGGAECVTTKDPKPPAELQPSEQHERNFTLDLTKASLDDRRATALDLSLAITWRRPGCDVVVSSLPIPPINASNNEPRVLATARRAHSPAESTPSRELIHLDYTLENPTMHFLTFELTMEANDDFAFSGAKVRVCNILPLSRETVCYQILPLVNGAWIEPKLRVTDRYFGKVLRVQGADGVRSDGKGISVWVDVDDEDS